MRSLCRRQCDVSQSVEQLCACLHVLLLHDVRNGSRIRQVPVVEEIHDRVANRKWYMPPIDHYQISSSIDSCRNKYEIEIGKKTKKKQKQKQIYRYRNLFRSLSSGIVEIFCRRFLTKPVRPDAREPAWLGEPVRHIKWCIILVRFSHCCCYCYCQKVATTTTIPTPSVT